MTKQGDPVGESTDATEVHQVIAETGATTTDPAWASDSGVLKSPRPVTDVEPRRETLPLGPLVKLTTFARGLTAQVPVSARAPAALGATALFGVLLGALIFHGGATPNPGDELVRFSKRVTAPEAALTRRALEKSDEIAALAALRNATAYEHLRADPIAQALRARLSLLAKDPGDALDWLEQALALEPRLADEAWAADAVVQTFAANKPARTGSLLSRLPKPAAVKALREGCIDWQVRVRHGAADALKGMTEACPDPVGLLIADAWQVDKCDAARAAVAKLTPSAQTDDRIAGVLDVLARRPGIGQCIADLLPRAGK